jgi:SAM-dependent methyltransferase
MSLVSDFAVTMSTPPDLTTPEVQTNLKEIEQELGIITALHPEDYMLRFSYHFCGPGVDFYFRSGRTDAQHICQSIKELLPNVSSPKVLEFASGYGRVSRHMQHIIPAMDLVACDIHPAAVEFVSDALGIKSIPSGPIPSDVSLEANTYDFIVALSFFSHIKDGLFSDWIAKLYSSLKEGGILLFSTHGETSMEKVDHLREWHDPNVGYGYRQESEQLGPGC